MNKYSNNKNRKRILFVVVAVIWVLFLFSSCMKQKNRIEGNYSKIEVNYTDETKNKTITQTKEIVDYINSFEGTEKSNEEIYYGSDIVLVFYDEKGEKAGAVIAALDQITVFGIKYCTETESVTRLVELCDSVQ